MVTPGVVPGHPWDRPFEAESRGSPGGGGTDIAQQRAIDFLLGLPSKVHPVAMLYEFIASNREEILARSRLKLVVRSAPVPTAAELANGLPKFLDQIVVIMRAATGEQGDALGLMTASASLHGAELLRIGLTVAQVVHDYGSICQTVTELAEEQRVPIAPEEFHTFNLCLDDAIAQAVTEYQDQRDRLVGDAGALHLGHLTHEIRNLLGTAMLAYNALSKGALGIEGSTGKLLGRTLRRMRVLIDRTVTEVRLDAELLDLQRVSVAELIEDVEIVATIEAKERDVVLTIDPAAPDVFVQADRQILASALANLVQNAFKYSLPGGHIDLKVRPRADWVSIDVQDGCGGLPPGDTETLFIPFEQRANDRSGIGIGLSISRRGVRAGGGDILVRDLPGHGCVFTIDVPRAPEIHP